MKQAVLSRALCFVHSERSASARCPSCQRYFCAECVTEHSGKWICAACLEATMVEPQRRARQRRRWNPAMWIQLIIALVLMWSIFYFFASFLGGIPDTFHDGTVWE